MATDTYTNTSTKVAGRGWTIASFALAAAALLFALLAAIPGVIAGVVAYRKGDPIAPWAIGASVVGGVIGAFIGLALVGV